MKTQSKLEKIMREVKETAKDSWRFVKDNAKIGAMLVVMSAGSYFAENARADPNTAGYLTIGNCLNSHKRNLNMNRNDGLFLGAKDGFDNNDKNANGNQPSGYPNCFSDIPGYHFWDDVRSENSNRPYYAKFSFNGKLTESTQNQVEFSFPFLGSEYGDYDFGNLPISFESGRLIYGKVVDVREAIDKQGNNARADLINVPAGTYDQWIPFGEGRVDIGTRLSADLNSDNKVDSNDYSILYNDFGKPQGVYKGDISGPNGIPDGYVNSYDVNSLNRQWLCEIILPDLDNNGKVDFNDFSILANDWGKGGHEEQYTGDITDANSGLSDGYVNWHDLRKFNEKWLWDAEDPNTW